MGTINTYHLSGQESSRQVINKALDILAQQLPVALPIYRRLQFGRFFDDTSLLLTNLNLITPEDSSSTQTQSTDSSTDPQAQSRTRPGIESPYILAFVDRCTRPETEVWLYASWESDAQTDVSTQENKNFKSAQVELLKGILRTCASLGLPRSIHSQWLEAQMGESYDRVGEAGLDHLGLSQHDYGGHGANPTVMLWGAIHEKTFAMLDALKVLSPEWNTSKVPNYTFVFVTSKLPPLKPLPEGMQWGEVQSKHFGLVRSRTQIPRQDRTMEVLPSVAIYEGNRDEPIAWAFVGLDGSETTLHVEPGFRGRGLAKAVATKLFTEKMERFFKQDRERGVEELAHGNVIDGNEKSVGVCKSLGGKSAWNVYWLRVDLSMVASMK